MKTPDEKEGTDRMDYEKAAMQRRIDNLTEQLELVKRQRDAAIRDIGVHPLCEVCKHKEKRCRAWCYREDFEWRGLCKENGGVANE